MEREKLYNFLAQLDIELTRSWLMLSVSHDRSFGGNDGYDDHIQSEYVWDSTVPNHSEISVGDVIVLWDKNKLVGYAIIEEIKEDFNTKNRYRCPVCRSTKIKPRKTKVPLYRCGAEFCGEEFDITLTEEIDVMTFSGNYRNSFIAAPCFISAKTCRELCIKKKSIHSMREINKLKLAELLKSISS